MKDTNMNENEYKFGISEITSDMNKLGEIAK